MKSHLIALSALTCAACAHAPKASPNATTSASFTGEMTIAAHLAEPGQTVDRPVRVDVWSDGDTSCVTFTIGSPGEESTTAWWVLGNDVVRLRGDDGVLLVGDEAARKRALVLSLRDLARGGSGHTNMTAHDTFGDVEERVLRDGELVRVQHAEHDTHWTAALRDATPAPGVPARPERLQEPTRPLGLSIESLDDQVFSIASPDFETRTLIVEFDTFLVALESSLTVEGGQRIVDAAAKRWPDKPIKYVSFSHHHPHYTGGLRAFMAAGATVVTTPMSAAYVGEIAARPFTLEPDAWSLLGATASIRTYQHVFVIEDANQRLELHDLGARSKHTSEYTVFYMPRSRVLFEGDIGWFVVDGALRVSTRFPGLLELVRELELDVDRLVQGWPIQPSIPFDELVEALER